jgi:hypothetical protein
MFSGQLRDRYDDLMHRQSKVMRMAIRLGFLAMIGLFLSTVVPTMAQDGAQVEPPMETAAPATPSDSATVTADTITATASPDASTSPSAEPTPMALPKPLADTSTAPEAVHALKIQPDYVARVAGDVSVDPRAVSSFIPDIAVTGSKYSLFCISGDNLRFDILMKRVPNPSPSEELLVAGDLSGTLRVSGLTSQVNALINSQNGMMAYSTQGGVAGKSLYIRYVAMSAPAVDLDFCAASKSGSLVTFRALGLDISNARGKVTLKH